jgi:hypothetical protein
MVVSFYRSSTVIMFTAFLTIFGMFLFVLLNSLSKGESIVLCISASMIATDEDDVDANCCPPLLKSAMRSKCNRTEILLKFFQDSSGDFICEILRIFFRSNLNLK